MCLSGVASLLVLSLPRLSLSLSSLSRNGCSGTRSDKKETSAASAAKGEEDSQQQQQHNGRPAEDEGGGGERAW